MKLDQQASPETWIQLPNPMAGLTRKKPGTVSKLSALKVKILNSYTLIGTEHAVEPLAGRIIRPST